MRALTTQLSAVIAILGFGTALISQPAAADLITFQCCTTTAGFPLNVPDFTVDDLLSFASGIESSGHAVETITFPVAGNSAAIADLTNIFGRANLPEATLTALTSTDKMQLVFSEVLFDSSQTSNGNESVNFEFTKLKETITPVPLPQSFWLLISGLVGLALACRRSSRRIHHVAVLAR